MDHLTARGIAEGYVQASEEEHVQAWQFLLDTGAVWHMPEWFGRHATDLITRGHLIDTYNLLGANPNYA